MIPEPLADEWSHMTRPQRVRRARILLCQALTMEHPADSFSLRVERALELTRRLDDPIVKEST